MRRTAYGLTIFMVASLAAQPAHGQPRPYVFGMGHFLAEWADQPWSYDHQAMDLMVDMGATAVWIDFPWAAMESTEGQINWAYADHQVDAAEARGLQMFAFVGTTPEWAKAYPDLPSHRTPPSEDHVTQFMDFHTAVAARYAGRVRYYQFWNEPSGCGWINDGCLNSSDCSLFTLWQKRAYDALKAGNPDSVVSAGGFDGRPANYVQCMYDELGGERAFDAVSIHPYAPGGPGGPGTSGQAIHYSDLTNVYGVMVNNGDADRKIWITEYGWNTTNEAQRAEDLAEVLTELMKPEYHYVYYAKHLVLNDWTTFCCYGLTDPWFNPKPAYHTFKDFDKTFPDHVDFTADVTVGPAPLTVQFTDMSSVGGATSWSWDFGDGQGSAAPNPTHVYTVEGHYTVSLTVTGQNGALSEEKVDYIRVGTITEIANPSFEDPFGYLNGWSSCLAGGSSIKQSPGTHIPNPRFHHGESSAGMSSSRTGDGLGAGAIWQEVMVTPGRTYRVRFHGFITGEVGEHANHLLQLRIRDGDATPLSCTGNGQGIEDHSDVFAHRPGVASPAWESLSGEITPTGEIITVIAYWKFAGTVWVIHSLHLDDWSIEDITPPVAADFNGDGHVDEQDLVIFANCWTGPALGPPSPGCEAADLNDDGHVDMADFAIFQRCISGPDQIADAACAE